VRNHSLQSRDRDLTIKIGH